MRPSILDLERQKLPVPPDRVEDIGDVRVISGKIDGEEEGEILAGGLIFRMRIRSRHGWEPVKARVVWEQLGRPSEMERMLWPAWDGIHDGDPVTYGHLAELERLGKC